MKAHVRTIDGTATIRLSGRFGYGARREFCAACDRSVADPGVGRLVLDFGAVECLDSSALGMLLLLKEGADAKSKSVAIARTRNAVRHWLEFAGFDRLFEIN